MRLLTQVHQNVCVVGDEDQSIYSWRGADIRNILDFEKDFPNAAVIRLEQKYRSTKNILDAAGAVILNNTQRKGKWLWTPSGAGARVTVYKAADGENEALFIAGAVDRLLSDDPSLRVGVLYRTNSQSRQIEEALRRYRRPYHVVGGFSFYQRAEIKDVMAYLKLLANRADNVSFLRIINVPARGIGRGAVQLIEQRAGEIRLPLWAAMLRMVEQGDLPARALAALQSFRKLVEELAETARTAKLAELIGQILERTGYRKMLESDRSSDNESRLENLDELVNAAAEAAERGEDLAAFLDHSALVSAADGVDERAQVSLLTLHNAKGLEFPVVFIAGMEEGLFPHSRSKDSSDMLEEERRLCYVGMTRAQQRLYLSWAQFRRRFGGGQPEPAVRSRFLAEVPAALVDNLGAGGRLDSREVDLFAEQHEVRQAVRKNLYTGKTYNSLDNIAEFFQQRGLKPPPAPESGPAPSPAKVVPMPAPPKKKGLRAGATVDHPKYGQGTVMRREGEGDDAKLTVMFPGRGIVKIMEKYAGLKTKE